MNTLSSETTLEPCWITYLKAVVFLSPAVIIWEAVSARCVPIFVNIFQNFAPHLGNVGWYWNLSMFLVRHGFSILAAIIVIFALLELFSHAWAHYRRGVVGAVVWLLNCTVIFGLASFFALALIVFPRLLK
jgi:hypothetical protein